MTLSGTTTTRFSLLGFAAILLVAWFCYRPGLSGDFQLDDQSNLGGLARVEDRDTAIDFILSGTAGPSGRPLALLTFVLQAEQWTEGAHAFLAANIAIHLLNAVLLAACLFQLSRLQGLAREKSVLIAVLAAGCWVLMPLLASANLLVVQRMTTLSATFVLLGLFGYLVARGRVETVPRLALAGMGVSLILGTSLSVLCKESGVLLPFYVLVIEVTLLQPPQSIARKKWRLLQVIFLGIPVALVLGYLTVHASYPEAVIAKRGFTGWERFLTELQLLWVYLGKALIGLPSMLGIYQTPPSVARSLFEPATLLSISMWVLTLVVSFIYRHRLPLLGFAVSWFLAGHILESTVLQLELYFEHRNYLPIVGPVYSVVAALQLATRPQWLSRALVSSYLFLSALLLYQVASMSGESSVSSRYWAFKYPESVRAVTTMATYQLAEEGPLRALATLDEFVLRNPQHSYLRIQELNLRCIAFPEADHSLVIEQLREGLPAADFTLTTGRMLSQLFDTLSDRECRGVDTQTLVDITDMTLENPRYSAVPAHVQFHYRLLAAIARKQGRIDEAIEYVETAIATQRSSELNMMMVTALGSLGEFDRARKFIEDAWTQAPSNPIQRFKWRRDLKNLREYIDELERYSTAQQ